jgi:hypothetical protein
VFQVLQVQLALKVQLAHSVDHQEYKVRQA